MERRKAIMPKFIPLLLLMSFMMARPAQAQVSEGIKIQVNSGEKEVRTIGIGVSLFNLDVFTLVNFTDQAAPGNSILVPINIGQGFRLEPHLGFLINPGFDQVYVDLGLGAYLVRRKGRMNILYGLRTNVLLNNNGANILGVGPAIGGEYMLGSRFSLGADVQIRGDIAWDDLGFFDGALSTLTRAILRVYL